MKRRKNRTDERFTHDLMGVLAIIGGIVVPFILLFTVEIVTDSTLGKFSPPARPGYRLVPTGSKFDLNGYKYQERMIWIKTEDEKEKQ